MPVDPVRGARVSIHLDAFEKGGRRQPPDDQVLDLRPGHRVPFDGRRVVHVVEPDLLQDMVGLDGARQAAQMLVEKLRLFVHAGEDVLE